MNNVPRKLRKQWKEQEWQGIPRICVRSSEGNCAGRLTKEHAIMYQGRSLQEDWAILDMCAYHHSVDFHQDGPGMNKEKHVWIALNRAPDERLRELSKGEDKLALRNRLNAKYGTWVEPLFLSINYI